MMIKIGKLGLRIGDFMKILIAAQNVVIGSVTSKVNTAITCNLTKVHITSANLAFLGVVQSADS
jgi:hypothetical protein